jgi:hypothetical protein
MQKDRPASLVRKSRFSHFGKESMRDSSDPWQSQSQKKEESPIPDAAVTRVSRSLSSVLKAQEKKASATDV